MLANLFAHGSVPGGQRMQCEGGVWVAPKPSAAPDWEPVEKTCDGLDNDCDGLIDEALIPPTQLPNGVPLLSAGVCAGAKPVCVNGAWQAPDYHAFVAGLPSAVSLAYEAIEQSCDGLDNDCDGQTDEALSGPLANKQLGVCAGATKICSGSWGEPNYPMIPGYQLGLEVGWDRLDNDCDGLTDEDTACPLWQVGGLNDGGLAAHGTHVVWSAGAGVVVHDSVTGARLGTHLEHRQPVLGLAISADGKQLASVGATQVLRVRPLVGPSTAGVAIDAPSKTWTAVAFNPDATQLATADSLGWVRILALPSGQATWAKKVHSGPVRRLLWLHAGLLAGARLFSGDDAGTLVAWQPKTLVTKVWTPIFVPATSGPVRSLAVNDKGTWLAAAWPKAGVAVLTTDAGVVQGGPLLVGKGASALAFDSIGRLWIGSDAGDLRRYHATKSGSPSWSLDWSLPATNALPTPGAVRGLLVQPDGSLLVAGARATGRRTLQGAWSALGWPIYAAPHELSVAPSRWAIAGVGGRVSVRPWLAAPAAWSAQLHGGAVINAIALAPASSKLNLATGGADGTTRASHLGATAPVQESATSWVSAVAGMQHLVWRGAMLYRGQGGQVVGLDPSSFTGKPGGSGSFGFAWTLPSAESVDDLAVDGGGQRVIVATSGATTQLHMIEIGTTKQLWARGGLAAASHRVAWRPDGAELLASGGKMGVQLLSAATGKTTLALPGHLSTVTAVAWAADGQRLLTASRDGAVRLWRRTATGVIGLHTSIRHCSWPCSAAGGVISAAFRPSSSSEWLTVGADGGVIGWRLP